MNFRYGSRSGFTLIELLTVIVIIAILLGLLFPAVTAIRGAARQNTCRNNVRSQTMALYNYYSNKQHFPMGAYGRDVDLVTSDPMGSESDHGSNDDNKASQGAAWTAYILPYLDQKSIYADLDLNLSTTGTGGWSVTGSDNNLATQTVISVFRCPSDLSPLHFNDSASNAPERVPCSYLGCAGDNQTDDNIRTGGNYIASTMDHGTANGILYNRSRVKLEDIPDGASNTIVIGEALFNWEEEMDRWYIGSRHVDSGIDLSEFLGSMSEDFNVTEELSFGSWHNARTLIFGFADGQTKGISEDIDETVRKALGTRNGSEKIGQDEF